MTELAPVRTHIADDLGVLTLGAAGRRNPLSLATMRAATTALDGFDADPAVRVIVIRAEGPAFSAGHDLSEMVGRTLDEEREIFAACTDLMAAVHRARQPVIAQVQGMALAAGCQLVATCDLAIAASDARFSTPGVKIGLFCSTPMIPLSRAVGRKRAMQMLLTGEMINAETAVEWGLINAAVPADQLEATVADLAQRIAASSGETLAIGKRAFYDQIDRTEPDAYAAMSEVMATNAMIPDAQEGMTAFPEKRAPVWR
ncbi:Probable enoyl-CoA hydratase echA8 (plasmid) [Tsukamurella tyrosinosolvens]|uniref:Enoyl-CoA hydratase domain-containing protein 3, mitochondrial n=1 Tax=Tsukamurella tyrosinosolvens TaxID=57704 RepID=A0A1H4N3T7_TSUTY|nr:enoyl-CoA hydratase [Tsukamurella tyrosinosolvens]KXO97023.1 enoyl-CoA hydratase [Tsukamurella tyrosinosolvens]SEB89767.1 Enoyl-CoA hydratase/carnithine racemase [Tsukamurella tyrosinosolvens]VEI00459.1 Probable enoyl-CoA hydratase echA8 [Tsukamurella tyrosinosolvens]